MSEAGWQTERLNPDCQLHWHSAGCLYQTQSDFQQIEVHQTLSFGRVLVIDGVLMTSERDEWFYHEPMVHVPMQLLGAGQSDQAYDVLVIGGGDGGTSRELCRYDQINVTLVELDAAVIDVSRQWLPQLSDGTFDDPRVSIQIADGLKWLDASVQQYDAIILDLTDPQGVAEALYQPAFFECCRRHLKSGGYLSMHVGSPIMQPERYRTMLHALRQVFKTVQPHHHYVPVYGTLWGLAVATEASDLIIQGQVPSGLKYYTHQQHRAWFEPAAWLDLLLESNAPS